jgi:hypothetical protein
MAKDDTEDWWGTPTDPNPYSSPEEGGRADDDTMGDLHGRTAHEIARFLKYGTPRARLAAIDKAIKFLKDNSVTSTIGRSRSLQKVADSLPSVDELEALMRLTPDS